MKKLIICILVIFVAGIFMVSIISDNFVIANSVKKIHFTKTITSTPDPGKGHENHQFLLILAPNQNTLYDGSMTFSSSEPVQVAILHEITDNYSKGQPTWTIDGNTIYAISIINPETESGSVEFTGAALALHSTNSKEFTATVSIDGWIRGQPTELIMQKIEQEKDSPLLLSRTSIPVTLPLHEGFYDGKSVFYIITDASQQNYANILTENQNWKVELASTFTKISKDIPPKIFIFKNGIRGEGIYGHQKEIFSNTPNQKSQYSSLNSVIEVSWKKGQNPIILESIDQVIEAKNGGRVEFNETGVVINSPQVIWPNGQMAIRDDKIHNELTYSGGQITEINKDEMTVTFLAHRSWGPDGKTIYHLITDATPEDPAEIMGIPSSSSSINLITNSSAKIYQFQNGIRGSGPLGFQPNVSTDISGNEDYNPIKHVYFIEWNNPKNATILETIPDIEYAKKDNLISISLARTLNHEHIVNYPLIDPFQTKNNP